MLFKISFPCLASLKTKLIHSILPLGTKNIALCLLCFILVGCGFHLQERASLAPPLHRLYLSSSDPYGDLSRELKIHLSASHVILTDSPKEADTVLVILADTPSEELVNVSGTNQTRQYLLRVTVSFEITHAEGNVIVGPQTLSEARTITIQSNQILGSSNQSSLYYQQMRRLLAQMIIHRLASQEITQLINTHVQPNHSLKTHT